MSTAAFANDPSTATIAAAALANDIGPTGTPVRRSSASKSALTSSSSSNNYDEQRHQKEEETKEEGDGGIAASGEPLPAFAGASSTVDKEDTVTNEGGTSTSSSTSGSNPLKSFLPTVNVSTNPTSLFVNTTRSLNNLLIVPTTASLSNLTTRKYTIPDKTVASQVLMYRQLLHTECRPGLRLSRKFQGTTAQRAVMHMPWWEQGVEQTGKMVISYDNLIVRLWLNGAIMPYVEGGYAYAAMKASSQSSTLGGGGGVVHPPDLLSGSKDEGEEVTVARTEEEEEEDVTSATIDTLIDERGLPPVPHSYWVERLGFQQTDPVTDFRSGGVLSLAMLVHIVEACPAVHRRFVPGGDAHMLPFGITNINVTDMIAKFLMFSKSVDRIDALLSSKPFWKMFGDPNALLVLQELSMHMLADVVVEMGRERKIPGGPHEKAESLHGEREGKVTVFDFPQILEKTERRVRDDLLGAGPKTVDEMRAIFSRLRVKYQRALERKERAADRQKHRTDETAQQTDTIRAMSGNVMGTAGGFLSKMNSQRGRMGFGIGGFTRDTPEVSPKATEEVDFDNGSAGVEQVATDDFHRNVLSGKEQKQDQVTPPDLLSGDLAATSSLRPEDKGEWTAGGSAGNATGKFTIDDDDDDLL